MPLIGTARNKLGATVTAAVLLCLGAVAVVSLATAGAYGVVQLFAVDMGLGFLALGALCAIAFMLIGVVATDCELFEERDDDDED